MFFGHSSRNYAIGKDYVLETLLLVNFTFFLTQCSTFFKDFGTLIKYNTQSNDMPLSYFNAGMLLPGVLVLYYGTLSLNKQYTQLWGVHAVCGIVQFLIGLDYLHDSFYSYFIVNLFVLFRWIFYTTLIWNNRG